MSAAKTTIRPALKLSAALLAAAALLLCTAAGASATVEFKLTSASNTNAAPGGTASFFVQIVNNGDTATNTSGTENTVFTAALPPALTAVSATPSDGFIGCGVAPQLVTCEGPAYVGDHSGRSIEILAELDSDASGVLTTLFEIEGGGATSPAHTADPLRVSAAEPGFGIDAYDGLLADAAGDALTRAAAHPARLDTAIDFNTHTDPSPVVGPRRPVEDVRDVIADLPPGLLGSAAGLEPCTNAELANGEGATDPKPLCPASSQVGVTDVRIDEGASPLTPVYNMVPPPGVPARFGFNVFGSIVLLDASLVQRDGSYSLRVNGTDIPQGLAINGSSTTFWGVPSDPVHTPERNCPGSSYPSLGGIPCASSAAPRAFLRTPTSCAGEAMQFDLRADSWQHPGAFESASYRNHAAPGYPLSPQPSEFPLSYTGPTEWGPELGIEACEEVPFEPTLALQTTTERADSPTGLSVDLGLPADCWAPKASVVEVEEAICQSDMRSATVTLPRGLSLNPSSANQLGACSPAQAGVTSAVGAAPVEFDLGPVSGPDASKLGTVEVTTPLLDEPLGGAVYLARQGDNPFSSLLALYLVIEGQGIRIKQAGEVSLDPNTGQLTTSFQETPQTPFSKLHVELFGGPRAALRTPSSCGTFTAGSNLTPWSGGAAAHPQASPSAKPAAAASTPSSTPAPPTPWRAPPAPSACG